MLWNVAHGVRKVGGVTNVVLTYWTISILMVFFNKWLVGSAKATSAGDKKDEDLSIFIAWSQSVVCVVIILVYSRIAAAASTNFQKESLSREIACDRYIQLVSLLFSAMLTFNNYCLKHVGIAFFQIARSFTLIFTVIFSAIILKKRASCRVVLCCCVVVSGFVIGVDQEKAAGTLSVTGVMFGVLASLFVALNGIYSKKALELHSMSSVKLTLHVNANGAILLAVPSLLSGQMETVWRIGKLTDTTFWLVTCASGVLGFLIAWASNRQIAYTTPITHHISNNTKSILQALLAVSIYQEYKSALWWLGCCVVLLGAFLYTLTKMSEDRRNKELTVLPRPVAIKPSLTLSA